MVEKIKKSLTGKEIQDKLNEAIDEVNEKQDSLISGENIKTLNGETILGSGDISGVSGWKVKVMEGF